MSPVSLLFFPSRARSWQVQHRIWPHGFQMDECEVVPATQQGYVVAGSTATIQPVPVPTPKEGECLIRVCAKREPKL